MSAVRQAHGWRLVKNYGNYGAYGWGFGIFYHKVPVADGFREQDVVVQFGPWVVQFSRLKRMN